MTQRHKRGPGGAVLTLGSLTHFMSTSTKQTIHSDRDLSVTTASFKRLQALYPISKRFLILGKFLNEKISLMYFSKHIFIEMTLACCPERCIPLCIAILVPSPPS